MRPLFLGTSALIALALTACHGAKDDTGQDAVDSVDSGTTDSEVQAADCTFVSIQPLVTSWSGGDEVTVTLDCARPRTTGLVLIAHDGEGNMTDYKATVEGSTLTAVFTTTARTSTGPQGFDVEVDGEVVEGDLLRYRLDPDELSQGVDANAAPASLGFGLSSLSLYSRNAAGRSLVVGSNDGSVVVGSHDEATGWEGDVVDASPSFAGPASTSVNKETGAQTLMVPLVDEDGDRFQFLMASDDGKSRRTEFIVLDFDYAPSGGYRVASGNLVLDSKDELSTYDVVLLGDWSKESGAPLVSLSFAPGKDGVGTWTKNWAASESSQVLHVSPPMTLSDGTEAVLVVSEGSVDGLVATWLSTAGGKTLASQTLKELTSAPLAISSTPVTQEKGDTLAVSLLDEDGALYLLQAGPDPSQDIGVQALALGNPLIARAIKAEVRRLVDATQSPSWRKGGGFRNLEPGTTIYFPPLQARSTDGGDLHVALSAPMDRGFGTGPDESLLVASWLAGEGTVDLSAVPDAVEQVAVGGRSVLSGGAGEKLTGSPVIFNRTATGTFELGALTGKGTAEVVLAGDGGWTVVSRGGQVVVVTPDGQELTDLPIDPMAGIQAYRVPSFRKVGEICVLSGLLRTKGSDGAYTLKPGLLTVGAEGVGAAAFKDETLASCELSRDEGADKTVFCTSDNGDGSFGVGLGLVTEDQLPDAGEELSIDLGYAAWPTSSGEDLAGLPSAWRSGNRASWGVDSVSITLLGSLGGEAVGPDLVAVLPYESDLGCPVATWFVPGASTDAAKNLAAAVLVSSSNESDCSDLAVPEAAIDLSGEGQGTVLMSQPSSIEGARELFEMVWDGSDLLALPTITVPEWTSLEVGDFDGDGLEELLVQLGAEPDADGTNADGLSGLMFRSGGLRHLSPEIRQEVTGVKNAGAVAPPGDGETVVGSVYELSDTDMDVLLVSGTASREVRQGNYWSIGVGSQPPPVVLSSWGAVLE